MAAHALQALFDGSLPRGFFRVNAPTQDVLIALQQSGWTCGHLNDGDTKQDFLSNVGKALAFPDHYGENLDALWDCLTDLTEPTALVWTSWHELAIEHPQDWAAIIELLRQRTEEGAQFAVVLNT